MLNLTEEQKTFLDKYNLNIDMVFDASWMKRKEYSPIMKELEKHIAIGVIPCAKAWHTMRTSFWSCLQCNTQSIAYINIDIKNTIIAGEKIWFLMKYLAVVTKLLKIYLNKLNQNREINYRRWTKVRKESWIWSRNA